VNLVFDNALLYNQPGTPFHKSALRLKSAAGPILADLDHLDRPDSASQSHAADLVSLLNNEFVDEMIAFDYELPKPREAKAGKMAKGRGPQSQPPEVKESVSDRRGNKQQQRASLDGAAGFRAPKARRSLAAGQDAALRSDTAQPGRAGQAERRRSRLTPSQPVFVDQVDNRSSFRNFESGWILPEGVSRRRTTSAPPNRVRPAVKSRPPKSDKPKKVDISSVPSEKLSLESVAY
jgi:hypothetical protein